MENEKPEIEDSNNRRPEPLTGSAQNLPIEVTTPQGKKLIFETPERAAIYLPVEVENLRNVLTGILAETNGYKARYFRIKHY